MMTTGNGLVFNGEGPIMNGTWYNPETGDSFTVRDTYFENNQLIVQTTDGRQLDYNFIQNYIKSENPILQKTSTKTQNINEDLPEEVKNLIDNDNDTSILQDDLDLINKTQNMVGLGNLNTPKNIIKLETPENVNFTIIEKALKDKSKPSIQSIFDWKNIPEKEMHLLIDVLGITVDELVEWYTKQVDMESIMDMVNGALKDYIYNIMVPELVSVSDQQIKLKENKPKKTKSTKK